ncbi:TetR/AcrR family transcriptional regulator [Rhodococcus opacus]|uniref:TetR/AcrR family transcriptional regulator n=1 Tax=Rhodococcus opacus TaxID=37919 RepID=UPI002236187E|nr:TetR/AcrR family transcriptional regulator [Rhodococcus opacus]UZG52810.1 TetR/AcrR family transcriptional regulator [Rhodococcus opacus]
MDAPIPTVVTGRSTSKAAARIRAAAIEVFAVKGYGATTTREIAASLDMSPGAVYPHYKTKESLLFAISLEGHRAALEVVRQADADTDSATARLGFTVAAYVRWHAENHALARVVQYELRSLTPEHFKEVVDVRRATSGVFANIIGAGELSGEFHAIDKDAAVLAITSLGVDVSRWFPSNTHPDASMLAQRYAELSFRIVGATAWGENRNVACCDGCRNGKSI